MKMFSYLLVAACFMTFWSIQTRPMRSDVDPIWKTISRAEMCQSYVRWTKLSGKTSVDMIRECGL